MRDTTLLFKLMETDAAQGKLEKDAEETIPLLLDVAAEDLKAEACLKALEWTEKIWETRKAPQSLLAAFSRRLNVIGNDAYAAKQFRAAETAFRILSRSGDITGSNNYAYMIRRGEVADASLRDPAGILRILRKGIGEKDAFSMANAALTLALMVGEEKDWRLADSMFSRMPDDQAFFVELWWENVAKAGEEEGWLVLFFLLRHRKITSSDLGSIRTIAEHLRNNLRGFPEWLARVEPEDNP